VTQSSKNSTGNAFRENLAIMSQPRSIAFSSICARAWIKAKRPAGDPKLRRFFIPRGGTSNGRSGRAGRTGALATPTARRPRRQQSATVRLNATFRTGSAAERTATAPAASPSRSHRCASGPSLSPPLRGEGAGGGALPLTASQEARGDFPIRGLAPPSAPRRRDPTP
jgi:hypothetical protein